MMSNCTASTTRYSLAGSYEEDLIFGVCCGPCVNCQVSYQLLDLFGGWLSVWLLVYECSEKLRRFYWKFYQFKSSKFCPFLFERPGKCCTHFFSGGKAAEERPRICVNLAICPQIVSGYTKRLLMHTKCCFIHCPINYLLTFWVVLVFHLRVGIVFHPTLFTASTWNTKTPVLQSDLRQRMDQYQPLWQFSCFCLRRNIGFIKKFPQLKAELLWQGGLIFDINRSSAQRFGCVELVAFEIQIHLWVCQPGQLLNIHGSSAQKSRVWNF